MAAEFQSPQAALAELLRASPDQRLVTFVNDRGNEVASLSRRGLDVRARVIARHLLEYAGLSKGDTALLVYPPGLEFVEALLGCFYAGVIPVPVPPPLPIKPEVGLIGYTQIAENCRARAQLTSRAYSLGRAFGNLRIALSRSRKWPDLPWIVTDSVSGPALERVSMPGPGDLALLQYTSGSTRAPKGAMVTHGNLWSQCRMLKEDLGISAETAVTVFWMPHYHDFSLIGGIIASFFGAHSLVLFSALGFLKRPGLWAELMHRYRANLTASPNFGYELLASRTTPEERARWDLSSLKAAICAAEPIRPGTVDRFLAAFEGTGLRREAFCPCYGLAEHTIGVTLFGRKRFFLDRRALETPGAELVPQDEDRGAEFVGCGPPGSGVEVRIVDPETRVEVERGRSGEIWIRSGSVAQGYFENPEETRERFQARIQGSELHWLRTGDLGVLCEGELVVLGRIDDMIILRGKNYFPQDIEETVVESDERVRRGRVIASAGESGDLVVFLELKEGHESAADEVSAKIRVLLLQELGLSSATLVFLKNGEIPKTTSGKLQRRKCKAEWLAGRLSVQRVHRGSGD